LLQGSAERSLRELTGTAVVHWLNIDLPEIGNRRADLLGETADGELIHIELQAQNDGAMALRMAEYFLRIYRHLSRFPRQIVLYVDKEPLRMAAELVGPRQSFRYDLIDIREIDGAGLLASDQMGDDVIAVLTRLRDYRSAVHGIVRKASGMEEDARVFYLQALFVIAGLRGLAGVVEEEAGREPMYIDILENEVLGREFKKGLRQGELVMLRRMLEARFGALPKPAEERLANCSAAEIEELGVRLLKAESLDELLK
jgi:hypothetical protein